MRIVMDHEAERGCQVYDVHEKNLGYDVTSLDLQSGELRLIEVKGLAGPTGKHSAHAQRAPRGRGPSRLLLAVRGHQLRNRAHTPGPDQRPRPVPVARSHQGRPLLPERERSAKADGGSGGCSKLRTARLAMKKPKIGADVVDAGFGRGFGAVDLSQMKKFYLLWPSERILQTVSEESPSESRHQGRFSNSPDCVWRIMRSQERADSVCY